MLYCAAVLRSIPERIAMNSSRRSAQFFLVLAVLRAHSQADTQHDREVAAPMRPHAFLCQRLEEARAVLRCRLPVDLEENRHELIAAVASNDDPIIELRAEHVRNLPEKAVALLMAIGVVEQLEAVDVHHDDAERTIVGDAALNLAVKNVMQ